MSRKQALEAIEAAPQKIPRDVLLYAALTGASSWDAMIAAGLRSAVLRCPRRTGGGEGRECGGTGYWRSPHPGEAEPPTPRNDLASEQEIDGAARAARCISDVWECEGCGQTTRSPRIGTIGSMKECSWRGRGRVGGDAGSVEDLLVDFCDAHAGRCGRDE